jgi:hypothetical protein
LVFRFLIVLVGITKEWNSGTFWASHRGMDGSFTCTF